MHGSYLEEKLSKATQAVVQMEFGYLSLFLYWPHHAWHMVGAHQISVSQQISVERRASTVKEKALYESRGRGGHLLQVPTSQRPYMHCVSYLYNSAPFTKERMRPKEAKPRVLVTVPPPGKIASCSFTVTLISRIPSPGLVLTPFGDSSPISLSLVTQMQ